ncbi:MAG: hypothetical protein EBY21_02365 [Alphaproteobacteria bacterium]|nr:hypothetical protein [Alphaproteobacteria bacterium]
MTDLKKIVDSLYELFKPLEPSDRQKAFEIVIDLLGRTSDFAADGAHKINPSSEPNKSIFNSKAQK